MRSTTFIADAIRDAGTPGDVTAPCELLTLIADLPDPIASLGAHDQTVFEAVPKEFPFFERVWGGGMALGGAEQAAFASLLRWLIAALRGWKRADDPRNSLLVSMFVVANACDQDGAFWPLLPSECAGNAELIECVSKLIASFAVTYSTRGGVQAPIWEREALDRLKKAEADNDWAAIGDAWRPFEAQLFPNVLQAQAVRYLTRSRSDYLAKAVANVRQTAVAMQFVTALKIEERFDLALSSDNPFIQFASVYVTLEYEEQAHYKALFPGIGDTAQYVFLNLLSGGGCLVCGSVGNHVADHLRNKLEQNRCPICDSPSERHEKVTAPADFSRARLRRLKRKVDQLREAANTAAGDIDTSEKEFGQLMERREEDRQHLRQLRLELSQLGFLELPSDTDIESLRTTLSEGEKELARLQAERSAAEARYGRIIKKQRETIDRTVNAIRRRFREYAGLVLAERCELNFVSGRRSIGQEGTKFDFPYFEVMMTSGVFDQSLSTRHNEESVSQSQREFLDIAFRLALINSVTDGKADSMLVLETPESSLDSLFVAMAGEALRHYSEDRRRNNVLIASTNLNNEEMLSALLGVHRPPANEPISQTEPKLTPRQQARRVPAPVVPPAERESRIINLLELAAPNAALKRHRINYKKLFTRALGLRGRA